MKLRFKAASIKQLTWYPLDEGSKFVLLVTMPLYKKVAQQLRSEGLCFDSEGIPRKFEGSIGLPISINGGDCVLGDRSFKFERAWKLKVGLREDAKESDITLWLTMRLRLDGADPMVHAFCTTTGKSTFAFDVSPAQGAFEFMEDGDTETEDEPITEHLKGPALASHREMKALAKQKGEATQ